jgi:hypothetical protein
MSNAEKTAEDLRAGRVLTISSAQLMRSRVGAGNVITAFLNGDPIPPETAAALVRTAAVTMRDSAQQLECAAQLIHPLRK